MVAGHVAVDRDGGGVGRRGHRGARCDHADGGSGDEGGGGENARRELASGNHVFLPSFGGFAMRTVRIVLQKLSMRPGRKEGCIRPSPVDGAGLGRG